MLQMMQTPLFAKEHEDVTSNVESSRSPELLQPSFEFESGDEVAAEVNPTVISEPIKSSKHRYE